MKFVKYLSVAVVTAAVLLVPSMSAFAAGSASLTVVSSSSATIGSTLPVTIYENGNNVNVVTADLSYDQGQLQYIGVQNTGSFTGTAPSSGGGGSVSVSRYATDGNGSPVTVSGNQSFAIVDFKVLGGSGSTIVSTASGSVIASTDTPNVNAWNGVISSTTIALSSPLAAPAPAPAPTPTPTPVTAPKTSTSATSKQTSTTPKTTVTNNLISPVTSTPATPTSTTAPTTNKMIATAVKPATVTVKNSSRFTDLSALGLILLALISGFAVTILRRRSAIKNSAYKVSGK